jgi:RAT1-interacting protein
MASVPNPQWHPAPSHHFLQAVLALVLKHVLPTDPTPTISLPPDQPLPAADVWRFSFTARRGCELYRVGEVGILDGRWGGVLDEKYVRWRMERPH